MRHAQRRQAGARRKLPAFLLVAAVLLFVVGVLAPAFTLIPSSGSFWLDAMLQMRVEQFSISQGIYGLLSHGGAGNIALGVLIFLFSVMFPLVKYSALLLQLFGSPKSHAWAGKLLQYGYWSMLDVFVIAVLVISFKAFKGGTRILPEWGIFCFAASVILSSLSHKVAAAKRSS